MNRDYKPSRETIRYVDAVLKLMSVLTRDDRFEEAQQYLPEGGAVKMCEVLDRIVEEGRAEGKVLAYAELGLSIEDIATKVHLSVEEIRSILSEEN